MNKIHLSVLHFILLFVFFFLHKNINSFASISKNTEEIQKKELNKISQNLSKGNKAHKNFLFEKLSSK